MHNYSERKATKNGPVRRKSIVSLLILHSKNTKLQIFSKPISKIPMNTQTNASEYMKVHIFELRSMK